jgi:hypothetical protein
MAEEKRKRGPKGGRERFQFVIPIGMLEEARTLADQENRSVSNMLATLVGEAITARKRGPRFAELARQEAEDLIAA